MENRASHVVGWNTHPTIKKSIARPGIELTTFRTP